MFSIKYTQLQWICNFRSKSMPNLLISLEERGRGTHRKRYLWRGAIACQRGSLGRYVL